LVSKKPFTIMKPKKIFASRMLPTSLLGTILLVFIAVVFSCKNIDEVSTVVKNPERKPFSEVDATNARNVLAQKLAQVIGKPEIQSFLLEESKRQKNVDNAIVCMSSFSKTVAESKTFASYLENAKATDLTLRSGNFGNSLINADPGMSIVAYLPNQDETNVSSWNLSDIQMVVVIPANVDESVQTFTAYYPDGSTTTINAENPPSVSLLVVTGNTHYVPIEPITQVTPMGMYHPQTSQLTPVYASEMYYLYNFDDVYGGGSGGGSGGGGITLRGGDCERDLNTRDERFASLKLTNCAVARNTIPWWEFTPHFRFAIAFAKQGTGVTNAAFQSLTKSVQDLRRRFLVLLPHYLPHLRVCLAPERYVYSNNNGNSELRLFNWDPVENGDVVKYIWFEVDQPDFTTDITVSLTTKFKGNTGVFDGPSATVSGAIKHNPKDDQLGEALVKYCDSAFYPGTTYNTGSVLFEISN
jgi:hypothetical protein